MAVLTLLVRCHNIRKRCGCLVGSLAVVRKIFRAGNSLVVSLPQEALATLGLSEGAEVDVAIDREHGGILIRPALPELAEVDPEFIRQMQGFVQRYRPALEELARE